MRQTNLNLRGKQFHTTCQIQKQKNLRNKIPINLLIYTKTTSIFLKSDF